MTAIDPGKKIPDKAALDVAAIRRHFSFPACDHRKVHRRPSPGREDDLR